MSNQISETAQNFAGASINQWLGNGQSSGIKIGHCFSTTGERKLQAHEHLFLAGDVPTHIYQILEGVVGVYNMLADGRRQIVTFCYPGDLIGIDYSACDTQNVEALSDVRVKCIPVSAIETLIRTEPGFGQAMMGMLATELAETRDQLLSLGRKSAMEKLATFLVRISKRNERAGTDATSLFLPMTRAEIADYLGLTIETVSRNMTKLKLAHVIRLETKSSVTVLDSERLMNIAEGEESNRVMN